MNRRGFFTSLAALATTAVLPSVPSISVADRTRLIQKIMMNSMYGKMGKPYMGGRVVLYAAADGIITTDMFSKYPCSLTGSTS